MGGKGRGEMFDKWLVLEHILQEDEIFFSVLCKLGLGFNKMK
jgi:hypothetical protein